VKPGYISLIAPIVDMDMSLMRKIPEATYVKILVQGLLEEYVRSVTN
jgi:hypothetical protein